MPEERTQEQIDASNSDLTAEIAKSRRPAALLASLGLIVITGGAVGGITYDLVVNGNAQSLTILSTLATLGMGGLLALSGTKRSDD